MRAHQPFSIDHHIRDIRGFGGEYQLCVGIVWIAAEAGRVMCGGGVHQDQVGAFACFERASQMPDVKRLGAHARRHQQGSRGRDDRWVVGSGFRNE